MKKSILIAILLLITPLALILPVQATTSDFTAGTGGITISDVTFGSSTASLLILAASTAESWTFTSGSFTVTNPGSAFKVGSDDSSVKSIAAAFNGGAYVACAENTTPSTSYVTLPTDTGTYTITPLTTTDCTTLCSALDGVATYNSFPTCGAATCSQGYNLVGSGASATCTGASSSAPGGSSPSSYTPTTETITTKITTQTTPTQAPAATANQIQQILNEAATVSTSEVASVLSAMGVSRDAAAETSAAKKYTAALVGGLKSIATAAQNAITNFVTYGTPTTKILGAGERAGVVSSYKAAFGKVPANETEWSDAIKIGNGRWPTERSQTAEDRAALSFKTIYLRAPDRSNPHDDAAVTVMAYGLRPGNRNLNSEKTAIKSFKAIFGKNPSIATNWDAVRAIAYSGATR